MVLGSVDREHHSVNVIAVDPVDPHAEKILKYPVVLRIPGKREAPEAV